MKVQSVPDHRDQTENNSGTDADQGRNAPLANAGMLEDHLPEHWRMNRATAIMTFVLVIIYLILSYMPVWHTDVWGHLSYGRWISQTGSIPHAEPLMPMSSGMPFVDTSWLSQWLGYQAYQKYEIAAIQGMYATGIVGCLALFCWQGFRRTNSLPWTLTGMVILIALNWMQWNIARPQIAGQVCFFLLLMLLTSHHRSRWQFLVVPLLFVLWANLHGSFVVGLFCLGASLLGRGIDITRRTRGLFAFWHDALFRRQLLLLELAATAVLLNPYGLDLYREVFAFSENTNLHDLVEWQPLTFMMRQGKIFFITVLALMAVVRFSPRRISAREVLWLVVLGCATLWTSRLIIWWGPFAAWFIVLHGHAAWKHHLPRHRREVERIPRGIWTVATLGLIWIAFAYAPLGGAVLHGRLPALKGNVSRQTPLRAVEYLHEHAARGPVFNSYEWGDYLLWAGPPDLQVFVASHAHLIPSEIWESYMRVIELGSGWDEQLDRNGFNTIVLNKLNQGALVSALKNNRKWTLKLDDGMAVIFERKEPI